MARKRRPTLAQRGERADAAVAAGKRAAPYGIAAGAVARAGVGVRRGNRVVAARASNRGAVAIAAGTVAYSANKARRRTAAKQGYKPLGYKGQVGRSRSPARRRGHHSGQQRRDRYGRFA